MRAGVVEPLEEGGLAVALLPDEHRLVPLVQGKGKTSPPGSADPWYGSMSNLVLAACRSVLPSARFAGKSSLVSSGDRRRNTTCACGPSRPTRFDPMAMPLKAAHGHFCYAFAQQKSASGHAESGQRAIWARRSGRFGSSPSISDFRQQETSPRGGGLPDLSCHTKIKLLDDHFFTLSSICGEDLPPAASAACMLYYSSIWEKVQLQFCYRERPTPPEAPGRSPGPGP